MPGGADGPEPRRSPRGIAFAAPLGHEYVGIVEEVGSDVHLIKPGQFVIGSFFASDNTREVCQAGFHVVYSPRVRRRGRRAVR